MPSSPHNSHILNILEKSPEYSPYSARNKPINYNLPSKDSLNTIMEKQNSSVKNIKVSLNTFLPKVLIGDNLKCDDYEKAFFSSIRVIMTKFLHFCHGYIQEGDLLSISYIIDIILMYYFNQENHDDEIKEWLMQNMTKWRYDLNINYLKAGIDAYHHSKELHRKKYPNKKYSYQTSTDNFIFNIVYQISKIKKQMISLYTELCEKHNVDKSDEIEKYVNTTFWCAYNCPRDF